MDTINNNIAINVILLLMLRKDGFDCFRRALLAVSC